MDPFFSNFNDRIKAVIEDLPADYVASREDIAYFKRYTDCDDYVLSRNVIKSIWGYFKTQLVNYDILGNRNKPAYVNVLHTNAGTGKILEEAPDNTIITAYNTDYVCKKITDFVNQKRGDEGNYFSDMIDISHFFAVKNTNSQTKYDIVITQPSNDYYKGIDCVGNEEKLDPLSYYTLRSGDFVDENGYIVVVHSLEDEKKLKKLIEKTDYYEIVKKCCLEGLNIHKTYQATIIRKTKKKKLSKEAQEMVEALKVLNKIKDTPAMKKWGKNVEKDFARDKWIDPAGGEHYGDEDDPAKMYE